MRRLPIRMYESLRVSMASEYIRGEGVLGLAVWNDRMLVERARATKSSSAGYLGITMEITTRLGSHTIVVASFVDRFVSTCASDTAPWSRCRCILFFHLPRLSSFVCFHTAEGGTRSCTGGHVRKRMILGFRTVPFPRRAAGPLRSSLPFVVSTFLTMKLSLPCPVGGTFASFSYKCTDHATRD